MVNIEEYIDLYPHNTFHIHAKARFWVRISSVPQLQELLKSPVFSQGKVLILGGGSNILLQEDFNGMVLKNEIFGIEVLKEDKKSILVKVGSGEVWHPFVKHCLKHQWGGLENLSLIPGTVGASPMQNIGAYGVEIQEYITEVEAVDLDNGKITTFSNAECHFGYRDSIFKQEAKGKYMITHVTFSLTKGSHELRTHYGLIKEELGDCKVTIQSISDAVIRIRRKKLPDPSVIGNAGSFFKNPVIAEEAYHLLSKKYPTVPHYRVDENLIKIPAGWLIEHCGWKGKTIGQVGVHEHQALVLVNHGGATGSAIWNLAQEIIKSVHKKFNIELHPEVNIIN